MTRRLLLMRHARARGAGPGHDSARELSADGWQQCARVGRRLHETRPDRVLSSPAIRCVQTAEAVVSAMELEDRRVITDETLGGDDGSACLPLVATATGTTLLVSHQPTLLGLGAALLGGMPVDLRPAQVAILDESDGSWALVSIFDPDA